jgi:pimeloyl-ACP methyl ester carboxylesterase
MKDGDEVKAYVDIGKGKPLVLIHGLGSKKESWIPQHELANKYRLIIPDLRGHGENPYENGISMFSFAEGIRDLLKDLKIDSAYICGLSLGGLVAQEFYKQFPYMVDGLILANSTSYIIPFFANNLIRDAKELIEIGQHEVLIDVIANRGLHNKQCLEEAREYFLIRNTYLESAQAPVGINYYPTLLMVDKPTLIISSYHDKIVPSINQYMQWYCLSRARFRHIDSGHLSNIEQRDKFNSLIKDFLD